MKRLPLLIAATLLSNVAAGQLGEPDGWWTEYRGAGGEVFSFFNACSGMGYRVSISGNSSNESALRETEIASAVESRLRAARIFDERTSPNALKSYLIVQVIFTGNSASLSVEFLKPGFKDIFSRHQFFIDSRGLATWQRAWLVQGFRSGDVLAQLSKYLDEFIANYLRVNSDEACEGFRVAEREQQARLAADRAAARTDAAVERAARAARWKGWSAEQCESLEEYVGECLFAVDQTESSQEVERDRMSMRLEILKPEDQDQWTLTMVDRSKGQDLVLDLTPSQIQHLRDFLTNVLQETGTEWSIPEG